MNAEIMEGWFRDIFLPETKPPVASLWRILILDGIRAHCTSAVMNLAIAHKVRLLYLPAHTSHVTQPLDVGTFAPLKHYYREELRPYANISSTAPVAKQRFLIAYKITHSKAINSRTIRNAFKAAGIWPTGAHRVLKKIQHTKHTPQQQEAPITPKKQQHTDNQPYYTPHSRKDLVQQVEPI
jgi:4-hydroxybenzoate polyprenyltransferase